MNIGYGSATSKFGPGVSIELSGDEVATAIDAWLVAHAVYIRGPRTVHVNGALCSDGLVYVDPSGIVVVDGELFSGRGLPRNHSRREWKNGALHPLVKRPSAGRP